MMRGLNLHACQFLFQELLRVAVLGLVREVAKLYWITSTVPALKLLSSTVLVTLLEPTTVHIAKMLESPADVSWTTAL